MRRASCCSRKATRPSVAMTLAAAGRCLARSLGTRVFESEVRVWFASRAARRLGDASEARRLALEALDIYADAPPEFLLPILLGAVAATTRDLDLREQHYARAEALLATAMSHNHLFLYCDGIDDAPAREDDDRALRYADALEAHTAVEPLPWVEVVVARARILGRRATHRGDPDVAAVAARARALGMRWAARFFGVTQRRRIRNRRSPLRNAPRCSWRRRRAGRWARRGEGGGPLGLHTISASVVSALLLTAVSPQSAMPPHCS